MANLSEEEKQFIEVSLGDRENVDFLEDNSPVIRKKTKKKASGRTPFYRRISVWIAFLLAVPSILTIGIMIVFKRVETFVGGPEVLRWLKTQRDNTDYADLIQEIGLTWLPTFLDFYYNQGIIIAALFTVSLVLIAVIVLVHIYKNQNLYEEDSND